MNFLYLHGFGSSPAAKKGQAFSAHFAPLGVDFRRPDLNLPSFEHLRLSAMIEAATAAAGDAAIVVGSSLGGLTAARTAARTPAIRALILLAPAFQLAARWRATLGPAFDAWQRTGTRDVTVSTGETRSIDFGFIEDAERVDVGFPEVTVPTLIFHGVHDDAVPVDSSRRFAAGRPNVRLVEVDDDHELVRSLPIMLPAAEQFILQHR